MNDDNPGRRGATKIDGELPTMRPESQAQASDRRCAPPHRLVWAVGGLPHTADRRMIAVQELASGKCRLRTYVLDEVARVNAEERLAKELTEVWLGADGQAAPALTALGRRLRRLEYRRQQQLAQMRAARFSHPSPRTADVREGTEFDVELFAPLKQGISIATELLPIERTAAWLLCLDEAEFLEPGHHRILNSHLTRALREPVLQDYHHAVPAPHIRNHDFGASRRR